jgi:hypothetical protein
MKLVISIKTGNAAFKPDRTAEIVRILRKYCDDLETRKITPIEKLLDGNGNPIGTAIFYVK